MLRATGFVCVVGLQPTVNASRAPHLLPEQSVLTVKIQRIVDVRRPSMYVRLCAWRLQYSALFHFNNKRKLREQFIKSISTIYNIWVMMDEQCTDVPRASVLTEINFSESSASTSFRIVYVLIFVLLASKFVSQ